MRRLLTAILVTVLSGVWTSELHSEVNPLIEGREFVNGADVSVMQRLEEHGGVYRLGGKPTDPLQIFRLNGFNWMRLRLFHSPSGKGPECNDLPYTLKLAKRIKAQGFRLLLDFHYSDTWADPSKQSIPAAWKGLSHEQLQKKVHDYTRNVIREFKKNEVMPDMVQIGNEVTNGILWEDGHLSRGKTTPAQWNRFANLIKAGIAGAADGAAPQPGPKIMIHIDRGGDKGTSKWFYDNLIACNVRFDVIGLSHYPWWQGSLENLRENLEYLAGAYKKDIIVVETSFPWAPQQFAEGNGVLSFEDSVKRVLHYPATPEGQAAYLRDMIQVIRNTPGGHGRGLFYWEPAWIKTANWGAPEWSPDWEHRALFDENGNALPAMKEFHASGQGAGAEP